MRIVATMEDQFGYTLLESVVSMVLFVSVLIPLGAAVGKLILSDNSNTLHHALRIAESEICSTTPQNEVSGGSNTIIDGFVVEKDVTVDGNLVTVKVAVASVKKPAKSLVALQKTLLVYK